MFASDLKVQVADYPFDPRSTITPFVATRLVNGRTLYRVYIRLEGPDVPLVRDVTYVFHESVSPPQTYLPRSDSNPDFIVDMWLWGTFEMRAMVTDIGERKIELPAHYLSFDSYFTKDNLQKFGLQIRKVG